MDCLLFVGGEHFGTFSQFGTIASLSVRFVRGILWNDFVTEFSSVLPFKTQRTIQTLSNNYIVRTLRTYSYYEAFDFETKK